MPRIKIVDTIPTIDLHGMTRQQAVDAAENFVLLNQGASVLIITGRSMPMQSAVSSMLEGYGFSYSAGVAAGNPGVILVHA
jgi:hypothetical protein